MSALLRRRKLADSGSRSCGLSCLFDYVDLGTGEGLWSISRAFWWQACSVNEVHYLGTDTRYHVTAGAGFTLGVRQQNLGQENASVWQTGQQVTARCSAGSATIVN